MLENKLNRIFRYYKEKYKLKTKLYLERSQECGFYTTRNHISYDTDWVKSRQIIGFDTQSIKEKLIFGLLHEIKHAIDWEYNREFCKKQLEEIKRTLYFENYNYQTLPPIEKRANKFAKKEIKKWIK